MKRNLLIEEFFDRFRYSGTLWLSVSDMLHFDLNNLFLFLIDYNIEKEDIESVVCFGSTAKYIRELHRPAKGFWEKTFGKKLVSPEVHDLDLMIVLNKDKPELHRKVIPIDAHSYYHVSDGYGGFWKKKEKRGDLHLFITSENDFKEAYSSENATQHIDINGITIAGGCNFITSYDVPFSVDGDVIKIDAWRRK